MLQNKQANNAVGGAVEPAGLIRVEETIVLSKPILEMSLQDCIVFLDKQSWWIAYVNAIIQKHINTIDITKELMNFTYAPFLILVKEIESAKKSDSLTSDKIKQLDALYINVYKFMSEKSHRAATSFSNLTFSWPKVEDADVSHQQDDAKAALEGAVPVLPDQAATQSGKIPLYKCEAQNCNQLFFVKERLTQHVQTFHFGKTYCKTCLRVFTAPSSLKTHISHYGSSHSQLLAPFIFVEETYYKSVENAVNSGKAVLVLFREKCMLVEKYSEVIEQNN